MPEKRIITDPAEAASIRKRLVDARAIRQIVLVATKSQPAVQGFKSESSFVISAWMSVNKACYAILKQLAEPPLSVHVGPGTGLAALSKLAGEHAIKLLGGLPAKGRAFIQVKRISGYPAQRNGPREFCLVTICEAPEAPPLELVMIENDELVPQFDAAGAPLIEFSPEAGADRLIAENLKDHLARNEQMWIIWQALGVSEQKPLSINFQFTSMRKESSDQLTTMLEGMGFTVSGNTKRTLLVLKRWDLTATESACWTLERLQARTRELYDLAARLEIQLDGTDAALPQAA